LNILFTLTNIGRTVATGVTVNTEMLVVPSGKAIFTEPEKRQKQFCSRIAQKPPATNQFTMFPNDLKVLSAQVALSNVEMQQNTIPFPAKRTGKFIDPIIVGCIDYQYFPFPDHHQTGFIFEVRRFETEPSGQRVPFLSIEVGRDLPASEMSLDRYFFAGDYAN
jgi:hypothetical protein